MRCVLARLCDGHRGTARCYCTCSSGSAPNAFSATSHATLVKCTFRICGVIPPSAHDQGFGVAANTCPRESVQARQAGAEEILPCLLRECDRRWLRVGGVSRRLAVRVPHSRFCLRSSAPAVCVDRQPSGSPPNPASPFEEKGKAAAPIPLSSGALRPAGGAQLSAAPDAPPYAGPAAEPPSVACATASRPLQIAPAEGIFIRGNGRAASRWHGGQARR